MVIIADMIGKVGTPFVPLSVDTSKEEESKAISELRLRDIQRAKRSSKKERFSIYRRFCYELASACVFSDSLLPEDAAKLMCIVLELTSCARRGVFVTREDLDNAIGHAESKEGESLIEEQRALALRKGTSRTTLQTGSDIEEENSNLGTPFSLSGKKRAALASAASSPQLETP